MDYQKLIRPMAVVGRYFGSNGVINGVNITFGVVNVDALKNIINSDFAGMDEVNIVRNLGLKFIRDCLKKNIENTFEKINGKITISYKSDSNSILEMKKHVIGVRELLSELDSFNSAICFGTLFRNDCKLLITNDFYDQHIISMLRSDDLRRIHIDNKSSCIRHGATRSYFLKLRDREHEISRMKPKMKICDYESKFCDTSLPIFWN